MPIRTKNSPAIGSSSIKTEEHFPYPYRQGHDLITPRHDRRHEQEFLKNREALCSNLNFRSDILILRNRYPEQYWAKQLIWIKKADALNRDLQKACWQVSRLWNMPKGTARSVAMLSYTTPSVGLAVTHDLELLCSWWGLQSAQDKKWALWLLRNWDPVQKELPPREPQNIRPWLDRWQIRIDKVRPAEEARAIPYRATLTLMRGISLREARTALVIAQRALGAPTKAGGRPGLSDREREELLASFEKLGLPQKGRRQDMIRKVQHIMSEKRQPLSIGTIGAELRKWIKSKGGSVKQYARE